MPKAPTDKDHLLASNEHEIWAARQLLRVSRYRYPKPWTRWRTNNSGCVSFECTRLMISLRCAEEKLSVTKVQPSAARLVLGLGVEDQPRFSAPPGATFHILAY